MGGLVDGLLMNGHMVGVMDKCRRFNVNVYFIILVQAIAADEDSES